MKRFPVAAVLAASILAVTQFPDPARAAEGIDEARMELAERIAELDGSREFLRIEWEVLMEQMERNMPEGADYGMTDEMMEIARQEHTEGQVTEWVTALAATHDEGRLRQIIRHLEQPTSRSWVEDQLATYRPFLEGMMMRSQAVGEVMMEEMESTEGGAPDAAGRLADLPPVTDNRLAGAFGVVPGARIEAEIENTFNHASIPASNHSVRQIFSDLDVQLYSDGTGAARVGTISATRSYDDADACDAARQRLESALTGYFSHTETTDCGTTRHYSADGETRMSLTCRDANLLGASVLRLNVNHEPTEEAGFGAMMAAAEDDEEDPGGDGGED